MAQAFEPPRQDGSLSAGVSQQHNGTPPTRPANAMSISQMGGKPMRVLLELYHCFESFAGIAQETRLVMRSLATRPQYEIGGLLNTQGGLRSSPKGNRSVASDARQQLRLMNDMGNKLSGKKLKKSALEKIYSRIAKSRLSIVAACIHNRMNGDDLYSLDLNLFQGIIWDRLFSPSLCADDRQHILNCLFYSINTGRRVANDLIGGKWAARINTSGWNLLIAQTPFPYSVSPDTRLLVRYHDAIPILYPDTLSESDSEAHFHYKCLTRNAREKAFFVCISGPVSNDLVRLAPQLEDRTEIVPTMVSSQFWPQPEPLTFAEKIVQLRACPATALQKGERNVSTAPMTVPAATSLKESPDPACLSGGYILAVSTLEPRKNYRFLITVWENVRKRLHMPPALVLVANPGWRYHDDAAAISVWRGRGLHHLWRVPIEELRVLYSAAHLVVCPSRAEGFDLSGVEAMLCGTPVIASDIPAHRWVYDDAALYFDLADRERLINLICELSQQPKDQGTLAMLRERGRKRAALYTMDAIAPRWEALLGRFQGRFSM